MVAAPHIPAGEYVPTADHRIVLAGVSWEHYEVELVMRGEKSVWFICGIVRFRVISFFSPE